MQSVAYPTMNAWIITPRTVLIVLLMMVLGGTFFYLFSEFRSFVAEPRLSIAGPLPGTVDTDRWWSFMGKPIREPW